MSQNFTATVLKDGIRLLGRIPHRGKNSHSNSNGTNTVRNSREKKLLSEFLKKPLSS
jgi:hypothetical protein